MRTSPPKTHPIHGGARLVSAPEAGSRARARDERVAAGDERIGPGGCGSKCARVSQSRLLYTTTLTRV